MKKMISRRNFLTAAGVVRCCRCPDRLRRLLFQHCRFFHRRIRCRLCRCFR